MKYFTPSNLRRRGFIGTDVDTETALYEYGILSRKCRQGENKGKFEVVIPDSVNANGYYDDHLTQIFDDITDAIRYYDWIDQSDLEQYADFKISKLGNNVYDMNLFISAILNYYGVANQ